MDNRMSCWGKLFPNGDQICEVNTLSNNKYIIEFIRDKKYIDIFFKHKSIKGLTNLFEQLEIFGLISNIISKYMEVRPEETNYRIKSKNKTILRVVKLIYKNHNYIDNFNMVENDNEICFDKKEKNIEYDIFKRLESIIRGERFMSDKELFDKIKNLPCKSNLEWNSYRLNEILKKRVKKYCKKNNIKIKDYDGELPFKVFEINVGIEKYKKRGEEIKKLEDLFFNNLEKCIK